MTCQTRPVALLTILYLTSFQLWSEDTVYSPNKLLSLMQKSCHSGPLPEMQEVDLAGLAGTELGKCLLTWGREGSADIPQTTYTLYRRFRVAGERRPYERPYFDKREQLTRAALVAWLGEDENAVDRVNDRIWNICEETTWVRRGCTTIRASELLVTTRVRANAAYINLETREATSLWNIRPACLNNLYPADGMLSAPNVLGGCT